MVSKSDLSDMFVEEDTEKRSIRRCDPSEHPIYLRDASSVCQDFRVTYIPFSSRDLRFLTPFTHILNFSFS